MAHPGCKGKMLWNKILVNFSRSGYFLLQQLTVKLITHSWFQPNTNTIKLM